MKPAPTTLREACEAEWQAQETALAQERAGLAPSGQPGIDMNRLLCRTLDQAQAPADVLPPDFATRLARQVASERSAGHVQGTGRFELLLAAGGLAALGCAGLWAWSRDAWWLPPEALPWLLLVAAAAALAAFTPRWSAA